MTFKPFADDEASLSIGEFNVENGTDRIAAYGNLELTRDKDGLQRAERLQAFLADVVAALKADPSLPANVQPKAAAVTEVKNPLA